ncbi:hypothetical protein F2P81_008924 [Scophthalmus maximus]|uniref:HMG box domain-containing protein n=1 Tax=Scophthalmus maximus TaxID=52904 RepID=A0A6A4T319_SCOMX|nr:hypothetical protein F2P81_008924 [Scophthalmus maximus]
MPITWEAFCLFKYGVTRNLDDVVCDTLDVVDVCDGVNVCSLFPHSLMLGPSGMHPTGIPHPAIVPPTGKQEHDQYDRGMYMKQHVEPKREKEPKKPVIKKPLNAFMLYMKEMRAKVIAECTLKESAAINQILGRRLTELNSSRAGMARESWLHFARAVVTNNTSEARRRGEKGRSSRTPTQTRALLRNAGLASASTNKRTGAVLAGVYQTSMPIHFHSTMPLLPLLLLLLPTPNRLHVSPPI